MIQDRVVLICSGAYIAPEFIPEVGRIPPALLPIGNRRLYEHQVEFLKNLNSEIYLSLPEDYILSSLDKKKLDKFKVRIIRVDSSISLGSSILYSWLSIGVNSKQLVILLGDTFFIDFDLIPFLRVSSLSVHKNVGTYNRAIIKNKVDSNTNFLESTLVNDESDVVSGLFSIFNPHILMQGIIKNNNDFIKGLNHYKNFNEIQVVNDGKWLDFGHLDSFFISRSEMTTQRAFNSLRITKKSLSKVSYKKQKMLAEASWYKNLPIALGISTPKLLVDYIDTGENASYTLEYLYFLPLNDLYVFGDLSLATWEVILYECNNLILNFNHYSSELNNVNYKVVNSIFLDKSLERLKELDGSPIESYIRSIGYTLFGKDNSIQELLYKADRYISPTSDEHVSIIHGDLCFSNILFDNRAKSIKVIDPRGIDSAGNITIYGDNRYDVAKLYHSVIGLYDFIIAGNYELIGEEIFFEVPNVVQELENIFRKVFFVNSSFIEEEIICINIMLFISMLPLHSDSLERQKAMFLNALRIAKKMRLL